jgi:hypothetical protein
MSGIKQTGLLKKLLLRSGNSGRLWAALAALFTGTLLLLLAVMVWWNFHELLYGKAQDDKLGSTFIVIGKKVTNENMGKPRLTVFTQADVDSIASAPQVQGVGALSSNHFPVYAVLGGSLAFSTDLALESVPDSFIDKVPEGWKWEPGDRGLPLIISNQFLDIYNYVFAPSQGLPQLSQSSIKMIGLTVKAGPEGMNETFTGHVVGFSDRINSVMAPQSFIDYGNKKYGKANTNFLPSRLILRAKDPSDKQFGEYLESHNYTTNSQNLRWSKMRAIVEVVASATGLLALLLMGIGTLVFVLFIELTIAKAQQSLTLLVQLGYSPGSLSRFMAMQFLPKVLVAVLLSLIVAAGGQFMLAEKAHLHGLNVAQLPGWPVLGAWLASTGLLVLLVVRSISRAVHKG